MAKAVMCPICGGSGELDDIGYRGSSSWIAKKNCHGCGGKGWVEVREDYVYPWKPETTE